MSPNCIWFTVILAGCFLFQVTVGQNDSSLLDQYYWRSITGNTPQLIQLRGFKSENHTVVTPDGYVIQIFRVINQNRHQNGSRVGYPMIVFNGLFLASEAYLDNADGVFTPANDVYTEFENNFQNILKLHCSPNVMPQKSGRSLVYTLAACGFDVWLPNVRDSIGYASHLVLDQNRDSEYWDINLDSYTTDAKAIINYVLRQAKTPTVAALCHSISCNTLFQLMAEYQPYNDLLKPVINLAPYVYSQHVTSIPISSLFFVEPYLSNLLMSTPDIRSIRPVYSNLVRRYPIMRLITLALFSLIGGINTNETDTTRVYRIPAHFPANAAFRVFAHMGQRRWESAKPNLLPKYDYGALKNIMVYGQPVPPNYDLTKITNRYMVLFRGVNDILADYLDIEKLKQVLRVPFLAEFRTSYSHTDFIFGVSINETVNLPILGVLHQLQLNYN